MIYYSLCQRYNNPCFYGFPFDEVQFSSCNEIDISPHSSINQQYIPSFPTISHILYIVESSMCFVLSDITIGRHGHLPLTVTARILRSNFTYKLQPYARTMSNCWFDCAHSCRQAQHFQLINPAAVGQKPSGKQPAWIIISILFFLDNFPKPTITLLDLLRNGQQYRKQAQWYPL